METEAVSEADSFSSESDSCCTSCSCSSCSETDQDGSYCGSFLSMDSHNISINTKAKPEQCFASSCSVTKEGEKRCVVSDHHTSHHNCAARIQPKETDFQKAFPSSNTLVMCREVNSDIVSSVYADPCEDFQQKSSYNAQVSGDPAADMLKIIDEACKRKTRVQLNNSTMTVQPASGVHLHRADLGSTDSDEVSTTSKHPLSISFDSTTYIKEESDLNGYPSGLSEHNISSESLNSSSNSIELDTKPSLAFSISGKSNYNIPMGADESRLNVFPLEDIDFCPPDFGTPIKTHNLMESDSVKTNSFAEVTVEENEVHSKTSDKISSPVGSDSINNYEREANTAEEKKVCCNGSSSDSNGSVHLHTQKEAVKCAEKNDSGQQSETLEESGQLSESYEVLRVSLSQYDHEKTSLDDDTHSSPLKPSKESDDQTTEEISQFVQFVKECNEKDPSVQVNVYTHHGKSRKSSPCTADEAPINDKEEEPTFTKTDIKSVKISLSTPRDSENNKIMAEREKQEKADEKRKMKSYPCPKTDCKISISGLQNLKRHLRTQHALGQDALKSIFLKDWQGQEQCGQLTCCNCARTFPCLDSFLEHHMECNGKICKVCRKRLESQAALDEHMFEHGPYKVTCPECGKAFMSKHTLCVHKKRHWTVKSHPCHYCDMTFARAAERTQHEIRIHIGDKKYLCSECGKRFCTKKELVVHGYMHTGERPHTCSFCQKGFATASAKTIHERSHTGDRPFKCKLCPSAYRSSSDLGKHMKRGKHVKAEDSLKSPKNSKKRKRDDCTKSSEKSRKRKRDDAEKETKDSTRKRKKKRRLKSPVKPLGTHKAKTTKEKKKKRKDKDKQDDIRPNVIRVAKRGKLKPSLQVQLPAVKKKKKKNSSLVTAEEETPVANLTTI